MIMTRKALRSPASILCLLAMVIMTGPSPVDAFSTSGSGEADCSRCHTLKTGEAEEILKDLVKEVHSVGISEVPGLYIIDATGKNDQRGMLYMDFGKRYVTAGNFISIAEPRRSTSHKGR